MRPRDAIHTPSTPEPSADRWITLAEASDITSLSTPALRNAERRGDLPGYRVLSRLRFRLRDVIAFMESGRKAPRRTPPPELLQAAADKAAASKPGGAN